MVNAKRKLLQEAQTSQSWEAVEDFKDEYIEQNLKLDETIRRQTDFDTIWERAFKEGGKYHLESFFNSIENEARKYD